MRGHIRNPRYFILKRNKRLPPLLTANDSFPFPLHVNLAANPRSLERLAEGVTQYATLGDRMRRNRDHVALRRMEAQDENQRILPQIETLRKKTKELQKHLEGR